MPAASLALALISILFVELFLQFKLVDSARAIIACSRHSLAVLSSKELSDREKETKMRENALVSLKLTLKFTFLFTVLCLCLYGIYFLLRDFLTFTDDQALHLLSSVKGLVALTAVAMTYAWIRNAVRKLRSA